MRADPVPVLSFLKRVAQRKAWLASLDGLAMALATAATLTLMSTQSAAVAGVIAAAVFALFVAGSMVAMWKSDPRSNARSVEQRASGCRNVVLTAAELLTDESRPDSYVSDVVIADAERITSSLDPAQLFPSRTAVARATVSGVILALVAINTVARPGESIAGAAGVDVATIDAVEIRITAPVYASRGSRTLRDPSRIDVIEGSDLQISVRARAASVGIETIAGTQEMTQNDGGGFSMRLVANVDGYIAITPRSARGDSGTRRLIGLSVAPDASPRIRITAPARDMLLPDASRAIGVTLEATDDFGLASLKLRYTKVSGSGERFTFTDGEVPIAIRRDSARAWHATGTLALSSFGLSQGDMLVYRGVAADARPGATAAESDSYIIEIASPGGVAAAGFAIDDERDRYGLSQQMVIMKTERLIARSASLPADSVAAEAMTISAEQRAVRAEFVFMMGGELAEEVMEAAGLTDIDETAEAEAEGDILAGRLANRGRIELVRAIRSMSRASTALNSRDLAKALADEKAALTYLQGAFARARYILRALTERERLDLSRRLSGSLLGVLRDARPAPEPAVDSRTAELRRALAEIASLGGAMEFGRDEASRASDLARNVLRIDPSSKDLQAVASSLAVSSRAIDARDAATARRNLDAAAVALVSTIRERLPDAPAMRRPIALDRLSGDLIDALRAGAGKR